jgi:polysaccharide biosynthesis protein PslH
MKILWVKSDYLHPTTRGGQIRTLEMLRCLHRRHEIHYVCFDDGGNTDGSERCHEYCARAYPIAHSIPPRRSLKFVKQLAEGLFSPLPVSVARYQSSAMQSRIVELLASNQFDSLVCDFLFPASNIPDLSSAVLFQHNVEAAIWRRHVTQARNPLVRAYFGLQARRMLVYESSVCRAAGRVVAVSELDTATMRRDYGVKNISSIPTGVDVAYFAATAPAIPKADLVFLGSMDWLPNIDGARFFITEILPRIRARLADCKIALVGRRPDPVLLRLAGNDPNLIVTGTLPDVRPWLWGSKVSIVPLRIGGGTRLKIFEAMAAHVPVVSTTVGAEGLPVEPGKHLLIADNPDRFAEACVHLLQDAQRRKHLADDAWSLVAGGFSWDAIAKQFESVLSSGPRPTASKRLVFSNR